MIKQKFTITMQSPINNIKTLPIQRNRLRIPINPKISIQQSRLLLILQKPITLTPLQIINRYIRLLRIYTKIKVLHHQQILRTPTTTSFYFEHTVYFGQQTGFCFVSVLPHVVEVGEGDIFEMLKFFIVDSFYDDQVFGTFKEICILFSSFGFVVHTTQRAHNKST